MYVMWKVILIKIYFKKLIDGQYFIKQGSTSSNEDIFPNKFILYEFIFKVTVENPQKFLAVLAPPLL